jgi:hypothetical protein
MSIVFDPEATFVARTGAFRDASLLERAEMVAREWTADYRGAEGRRRRLTARSRHGAVQGQEAVP